MSDFHLGRYGRRLLQGALTHKFSHTFYASLEAYLTRELQADKVTVKRRPEGSHWISVPLTLDVRTRQGSHFLFAKVVTEKGLRNFNYAVESRNLRVQILSDLCELRYKRARSKREILSYEAETLVKFREAKIYAPLPLKLLETGFYSLLVLEYIEGTPLGETVLQREDALCVLRILRQLWDHSLVHGDIKLDNFVRASDGRIYLIDCLNCVGPLQSGLYYDLASALYSLSRKLEPSVVLEAACQFFDTVEVNETLELIDLAGVQADALTDGDKAVQIKAAMQSI